MNKEVIVKVMRKRLRRKNTIKSAGNGIGGIALFVSSGPCFLLYDRLDKFQALLRSCRNLRRIRTRQQLFERIGIEKKSPVVTGHL